jgi:DNA-binding Lrp family transcriptional regulator
MKDSRRSDRELAKALGVSQPTVTRTRARLEKEKVIKEYTMVPDFHKLGFQILAITFLAVEKEPDSQEFEGNPFHNVLMIEKGLGLKHSHVVISLHQDYSSYADFERSLKQNSWTVKNSASFLVNLNDAHGLFSFSALTKQLMKSGKEQKS